MSVHVERPDGTVESYQDQPMDGMPAYREIIYSYEVEPTAEALRVFRHRYRYDSEAEGYVALRGVDDAAYYRSSQWVTVKQD